MIYELSERHRNCLFLDFAIQLISDSGFQAEISAVASVSSHLTVFERVLASLLEEIISCKDSKELERLLSNFSASGAASDVSHA